MALSLDDIRRKKRSLLEGQKKLLENERRGLRPWESVDRLGPQLRTLSAQQAVKKAREIVDRNNKTTLQRLGQYGPSESELDIIERSEEKLFDSEEFEKVMVPHFQARKRKSFWQRLFPLS